MSRAVMRQLFDYASSVIRSPCRSNNGHQVVEGINMRHFRYALLFLSALAMMIMPVAALAQTLIIRIAPPELPVYEQPAIPAYGYIWAPGYWAYGPDGYFWVPGTWVQPPSVGLLFTPGYWGWREGVYVWNAGYWGPHIGFYGGVNYGFGYGGVGYEGGRWNNGVFAYNRTVNNFGSVTITNVYNQKQHERDKGQL
jgi:WXXGXW repeat (2 copies)